MLDEYLIGKYAGGDSGPKKVAKMATVGHAKSGSMFGGIIAAFFPLLVILLGVLYKLQAAKAASA
jgi:hypothetical protein